MALASMVSYPVPKSFRAKFGQLGERPRRIFVLRRRSRLCLAAAIVERSARTQTSKSRAFAAVSVSVRREAFAVLNGTEVIVKFRLPPFEVVLSSDNDALQAAVRKFLDNTRCGMGGFGFPSLGDSTAKEVASDVLLLMRAINRLESQPSTSST